jgi:hypothetical protein
MTAVRCQRGATLVVALVMLTMLALFAITAHQTSLTDLKSSGNMQARMEALNAAQEAIETAISTPQFTSTPGDAVPNACGAPNTLCTDFNKDGTPEYRTRLEPPPSCIGSKVIKSTELNLADNEDLGCAVGQGQAFGIEGADAAASDSLCANTTWHLSAKATAPASGATIGVSQGIGIRIGTAEMAASCL